MPRIETWERQSDGRTSLIDVEIVQDSDAVVKHEAAIRRVEQFNPDIATVAELKEAFSALAKLYRGRV